MVMKEIHTSSTLPTCGCRHPCLSLRGDGKEPRPPKKAIFELLFLKELIT